MQTLSNNRNTVGWCLALFFYNIMWNLWMSKKYVCLYIYRCLNVTNFHISSGGYFFVLFWCCSIGVQITQKKEKVQMHLNPSLSWTHITTANDRWVASREYLDSLIFIITSFSFHMSHQSMVVFCLERRSMPGDRTDPCYSQGVSKFSGWHSIKVTLDLLWLFS